MSKKKTRKKTGGFGYEDYFRRTRNRESRETYYNDKQFNKDIKKLLGKYSEDNKNDDLICRECKSPALNIFTLMRAFNIVKKINDTWSNLYFKFVFQNIILSTIK